MKEKEKAASFAAVEKEILLQIHDLKMSLEEAEETLGALRTGEIDGLVVKGPGGERILTLRDADITYRILVEAMQEGAMVLSPEGIILYCNRAFASLMGAQEEKMTGLNIYDFLAAEDRSTVVSLIDEVGWEGAKAELLLERKGREPVPVYLSISRLPGDSHPAFCVVVTDLTELSKAVRAMRESEERRRYLSQQLLVTQDRERRIIAQDIHDGLGQILSAIMYAVEGISRTEVEGEALANMKNMIQQAIQECRRIHTALRPPMLEQLGIIATLNWLCRNVQEVNPHLKIEKQFELVEEAVPKRLREVIYRICQEALHNAMAHSGADCLSLSLATIDGKIELSISDNGHGFDPQDVPSHDAGVRGIGLASMRERAEMSGGVFSIDSRPGEGTAVKARWPLEQHR